MGAGPWLLIISTTAFLLAIFVLRDGVVRKIFTGIGGVCLILGLALTAGQQ